MPGKRSDPKKLAKERAEIERDIERRERPSLLQLVRDKIAARRRARAGFGPPPQREGAEVIGFQQPRGDA